MIKVIIGAIMILVPIIVLMILDGIEQECWWKPFAFLGGLAIFVGWFFFGLKLLLED